MLEAGSEETRLQKGNGDAAEAAPVQNAGPAVRPLGRPVGGQSWTDPLLCARGVGQRFLRGQHRQGLGTGASSSGRTRSPHRLQR